MLTEFTAGAYCVGDDVKALEIMPIRFKSSDALADKELAQAAFADLDPGFAGKALAGEYGIVVAGRNFGGGGKSIEGPVFALRGAGIKLVIADSFARYFLRNAINNGFPILVCDGNSAAVQTGQQLSVDLRAALIRNLDTGQEFRASPLSSSALEILNVGGLVPYARRKLAERNAERAPTLQS
jgi:3-isopropylmalate/(R)-2-methylmalate dehydratase small subunit